MGCNFQPLPGLDLAFQTFSILYRIEWVVTGGWLGCAILDHAFSILYRIEWVVTSCNSSLSLLAIELSVSCIGSNGL